MIAFSKQKRCIRKRKSSTFRKRDPSTAPASKRNFLSIHLPPRSAKIGAPYQAVHLLGQLGSVHLAQLRFKSLSSGTAEIWPTTRPFAAFQGALCSKSQALKPFRLQASLPNVWPVASKSSLSAVWCYPEGFATSSRIPQVQSTASLDQMQERQEEWIILAAGNHTSCQWPGQKVGLARHFSAAQSWRSKKLVGTPLAGLALLFFFQKAHLTLPITSTAWNLLT